jgi:DivIVA domain-containing protein
LGSSERRFETAFRGYATDEVDAYLDRVGRRLAELAAENERLAQRIGEAERERDEAVRRAGALEAELAGTVVSLRGAEAQIEGIRSDAARRLRIAQELMGRVLLEVTRRGRSPTQEAEPPAPRVDVPPPPVGLSRLQAGTDSENIGQSPD